MAPPSAVTYYAYSAFNYSVVKVRQPRNLKDSAAHVRAHHACHRLHFGDVLPTIGGTRGARSAIAESYSAFKVQPKRFASVT